MVNFNQLSTAEQINLIAKRNGKATTVKWHSDQTKYMAAAYKSLGVLSKDVRMTLTTDKKYENTKIYSNHEHTGSSWMERVECEAKGIVKHKKTGKMYVQLYPIKGKDGKLLNKVETHWYLNGTEISAEEAKALLVESKRKSDSDMEMMCIALDNIEFFSGMTE